VLINNVGYQVFGFVQNTSVEEYEKNYRVNTLAPIALIQCILPDMLRQKKGLIANVMSSVMYHSFPAVSSYTASKKALEAVHQSLKEELSLTPIKTLYIEPGCFRSNYWKNTEVGDRVKNYKFPTGEEGQDPSYVASRILKAIEEGKANLNLGGFKDKVGYHLSYWAPRMLEKLIIHNNKRLIEKLPKF
jgi:short-subunit dehydrogenase